MLTIHNLGQTHASRLANLAPRKLTAPLPSTAAIPDAMTMPFELIATTALIISFAYIVFGLTGFGSSITAMPFLVLLYPLRFAVPFMLLLDLSAALLLGWMNRHAVDRAELLRLLPFTLVGIALGLTILVSVPERPLLLLLGLFVLTSAARGLFSAPSARTIASAWSFPLGLAGGLFTALFGTGGPLYAVYLAGRLHDKSERRATIAALICISGLARLALFGTAGLFGQPNLIALAALLLPCMILGFYIGSCLHKYLSAQRVVQALWILLLFGSVTLIWRSLRG
jgi:uncharacterized protein